jgi:frataxin-like iron-binding protein CyaY
VSDREFQEAADAVYAEIAEALEAAVEPVLCWALPR